MDASDNLSKKHVITGNPRLNDFSRAGNLYQKFRKLLFYPGPNDPGDSISKKILSCSDRAGIEL
jgi:hypothetical protein